MIALRYGVTDFLQKMAAFLDQFGKRFLPLRETDGQTRTASGGRTGNPGFS